MQPPYKPLNQKGLLPTPMQNTLKASDSQGINTQTKPKILVASERTEKLAKGLCFFYDQPYERGHKCNIKKTQLFLIEIPGIDEEEGGSEVMGKEEGKLVVEEEKPQICPCFEWSAGLSNYAGD